jgi:phosphoribosylamine--glycine ligase
MRVLVVGSGGREHALVWKIRQSSHVSEIYCAPGNPGIAQLATCLELAATDTPALLRFAKGKEIGLTVVGPEAPLVNGIVDEFEASGLNIFGPSRRAAMIEGSKAFAKGLLEKYNIPTAQGLVFDVYEEARSYLQEVRYPIVVKADGLAAGKGTFVCHALQDGLDALDKIMRQSVFGKAGSRVVVEEFMVGEEASVLALTDGSNLVVLPPAQDHKRIFDNDEGPNTGGMGAYAPAPVVDGVMLERIRREILEPTIRALAMEGRTYRGVLYAGLMITAQGPRVVEFNCRFGDPEAQCVLPVTRGDLVEGMLRITQGDLGDYKLGWDRRWAVCVVVASGGYPGPYDSGKEILGLDRDFGQDVIVFHAGSAMAADGRRIMTAGGRVLGVTGIAEEFRKARELAYSSVKKITFDRAYYRKDIGARALKRLG